MEVVQHLIMAIPKQYILMSNIEVKFNGKGRNVNTFSHSHLEDSSLHEDLLHSA